MSKEQPRFGDVFRWTRPENVSEPEAPIAMFVRLDNTSWWGVALNDPVVGVGELHNWVNLHYEEEPNAEPGYGWEQVHADA